jgi:DNA repair exonuclease SbcCD ATPase subunit
MAGNSIKGISVSIAGDTKDLNSALQGINKDANALQRELNLVNKQLKFDPTNSVLLAQKQEILEEKITTTRKALQQLEDVQEQVEKQAKSGELGADKYRAYQREVETTKSILRNLESQLDDINTSANNFENNLNQTDLSPTAKEIKNVKDEVSNLEDKSKKTDLSSFKKELDDVKTSASKLKDELQSTAQDLGAGIAVAGGAAVTALMSFDSVEGALNHIQAQTGKTDAEMNGFKESLEAIYKGNYGEDMLDIANVMATVAQHTKESDPKKLQQITESAYALQDTFGYDYVESIRAAKMLVDQFGISYDEAFNLIVQGTQKGLEKNGDLLDTINEYSVHYKQQGYSAEQFFNSLEKGTEAGTFSIDKLGDAMKEFGIRSKDNSTTSIEAFELLGYSAKASSEDIQKAKDEIADLEKKLHYAQLEQQNFNDKTSELTKQKTADDIAEYSQKLEEAKEKLSAMTSTADNSQTSIDNLQAKFASGGETAREATQEVLEKLFALDDKVVQNQIGVALFGSMWEDLGIDGVKALMDVSGTADKTVASMEKIKDVEYDDLGNKLEKLGRKAQTEIIHPLIEKAYPKVEDGIEWVTDNLDNLIPIVEGLGRQAAIVWGVKKTTAIVNGVVDLVKTYKTLTTTTSSATNAQKGLNAAQKANVVGAIVGGVLTLINAVETYQETEWENSSLKKEIDNINTCTEKWSDLADEMSSTVDNINDTELSLKVDFENVNELKTRLQEIISDGTIDESEKGEYKTIVDLLSEKIDGFDTHWNNLSLEEVEGKITIKDNISEVNQELDTLINNWEITQAKLTFSESYSGLQTEIAKKKAEISSIDTTDLENSKKEFVDYIFESSNLSKKESKILVDELLNNNGDFDKAIKNLAEKFNNGKLNQIDNPNLWKSILGSPGKASGNIFGLNDLNGEATKRIKEYTDSIVENENAIKNANSQLDSLKITSEEYKTALDILNGGQGDYIDYIRLSTELGISQETVLGLLKDKGIETWQELENKSIEATNNVQNTLQNKTPEIEAQVKDTAEKAKNAAGSVSFNPVGQNTVDEWVAGIKSKKWSAGNAGTEIAEETKKNTEKISLFASGNNVIAGLLDGMLRGNGFKKIGSVVGTVCLAIYNGFCSWWDMHSPAKKANPLGKNIDYGIAVGFEQGEPELLKSVDSVSNDVFDRLNANNQKYKFSLSATQAQLNKLSSGSTILNTAVSQSKTINNTPNININISGVTINNDNDINDFAHKILYSLGDIIVQDGLKWG